MQALPLYISLVKHWPVMLLVSLPVCVAFQKFILTTLHTILSALSLVKFPSYIKTHGSESRSQVK